jgi:WD40 repeat protein
LVLSGVIPALLKENAEGRKTWSYLVFRPDQNPVDHLAAEMSAFSASAGFTQLTQASVAASLHNRSEGLTEVVNRIRKNLRQQIVIVIDQFEEIFRFSPAAARGTLGDDATDFIDLMVNAIQKPDHGLHIIVTLRSEYVSDCARFHSLTNLMNGSSYLLPQIPNDLLGAVIEEPVKAAGASIDRSLVRLILSELGDRPGQLPVLQHLMMRLWNQWSRAGDMSRPMSVADYEAVGQLQGAISQHAGLALESLDERHRYVCSRLFRTITTRADNGRELRKPERISTVAAQTGCTEKEILSVAEVFRSPEYSFITPSKEVPLNRESIIDLTHESIIRLWGTLRRWMDDEEASVKLYMKLAAAAEQYQEGTGRLWGAPDLLVALRWRDENNPTLAWAGKLDPAFERAMLFLKNSEEEYVVQEEYSRKTGTESIKRSRVLAGLLGLITLMALIALGAVYSLRNRAEKQKSVAVQMKEEAVAYSDRLSDSLSWLAGTFRTTAEQAGNENMNAVAAAGMAAEARDKATAAESMVQEIGAEKTAAVNRANEEKRYRMLSLARSLAMRSLNHDGDKDLQILLAWQAYIFNNRHSGITEDADVFSALYEVSKRYGNRFYSRFGPEGADITAMADVSGGQYFYTADTRGRVVRWQSDNPARGFKLVWSGDKVIRVMTLSPDASWLACGTETSEIVMIPIGDDTVGYQLQDSSGTITALLFSTGGEHLYSSTTGGGVNDWDLKTRRSKGMVEGVSGIAAMEISQDNTVLAALTKEGRVLCWKTQSPEKQVPLETGDRVITTHKFIPGGVRLATGDDTGIIDIWNTTTKSVVENIDGHLSAIKSIAFDSSDGQMLTADDTGEIKLWTLANLAQPPVVFTDSDNDVIRLAFCENGEAFLTATHSEVIRRPAHVRCMTTGLCDKVTRNLSEAEWSAWVGSDIEYEAICPDKGYHIRVREIRGAR